jgi:hypothetical protein
MSGKRWVLCLLVVGCGDIQKDTEATGGKVIGKTTTDIKKFDPNAPGQKVSDGSFEYTDPFTGPLNAYGPAMERSFIPLINNDIRAFHALEGRYPKDHAEFMEKIIKGNERKLPVLPGSKRWVYDEKNHELKVVEDAPTPKEKK